MSIIIRESMIAVLGIAEKLILHFIEVCGPSWHPSRLRNPLLRNRKIALFQGQIDTTLNNFLADQQLWLPETRPGGKIIAEPPRVPFSPPTCLTTVEDG